MWIELKQNNEVLYKMLYFRSVQQTYASIPALTPTAVNSGLPETVKYSTCLMGSFIFLPLQHLILTRRPGLYLSCAVLPHWSHLIGSNFQMKYWSYLWWKNTSRQNLVLCWLAQPELGQCSKSVIISAAARYIDIYISCIN